jgi:CheY-like chemotaxis protein
VQARRILIVEDDADLREALAEAMADAGAEVVVAADGVDALARLRSGPRPSVILLDLRLPGSAGRVPARDARDPSSSTCPSSP